MLTTASERRVDYIQPVNEGDLRPHCNLTLAKLYNKKLVGTDLLITGFFASLLLSSTHRGDSNAISATVNQMKLQSCARETSEIKMF